MSFKTFYEALKWARANARDYCHPYHKWEVIERDGAYRVAVYSVNTGQGRCI